MDKIKILCEIEKIQNKIAYYNKQKAKLHKDLLYYDLELNKIMAEYNKLCQKLISNNN